MTQTEAMTATNVYQPGVCNIGPAEIRQRRMTGIVGAIFAVAFLILAFALRWPAPVRLIVFIPVAIAATGFLQAAFHFCVRFGTQEAVHEAEYRRKDQRKALLIVGLTVLIAAAVAIVAFLIPLP